MLQLNQVLYTWPGSAGVCVDVPHLHIQTGQKVFLYGPSGCGKSTLLGLLAGVLLAQRGQVQLLGQNWANLSGAARDARRARHVGVIFQQFNLLPYLSVLDNTVLPCRFSAARAARCVGGPVAAAKVLLAQVGLPAELWQRRASQLSVGQQQRVAAARALMGNPELLIADEPTSALDEQRRQEFMQLLLQACDHNGTTLVFVSHDERLADAFDQRLSLPALNCAHDQAEKGGSLGLKVDRETEAEIGSDNSSFISPKHSPKHKHSPKNSRESAAKQSLDDPVKRKGSAS